MINLNNLSQRITAESIYMVRDKRVVGTIGTDPFDKTKILVVNVSKEENCSLTDGDFTTVLYGDAE